MAIATSARDHDVLAPPPGPVRPPAADRLRHALPAEVVQWPHDAERRAELARHHQPCVLVVGSDEPPPATTPLEDWVREPVDRAELTARLDAVFRRACCSRGPTVADGVVLHRGAWVAIPPAQLGMAELLVARLGAIVPHAELAQAAAGSGGSAHGVAVKGALTRLGRRLSPLGLDLTAVRGRGYLLDAHDRCPVHPIGGAQVSG